MLIKYMFTAFAAILLSQSASAQQPAAGWIRHIEGGVLMSGAGSFGVPKVGSEVHEGSTFTVAPGGVAHLEMVDGGAIALRPGARVKIVKYSVGPSGGEVRLEMEGGGIRAVTGWMTKSTSAGYAIKTPNATVTANAADMEVMMLFVDTYFWANSGEIAVTAGGKAQKIQGNTGQAAAIDAKAAMNPRAGIPDEGKRTKASASEAKFEELRTEIAKKLDQKRGDGFRREMTKVSLFQAKMLDDLLSKLRRIEPPNTGGHGHFIKAGATSFRVDSHIR